ncbi:hypothetical protein, partial [Ralstonia pseudosolanacearum]|uniref:hypothetical protein n=3 Tax=Ralstonia pseudosolanacearum TaxID=1310165 RepID=UPI001E4975E0
MGYYDPDGLAKYNAILPGQTSFNSAENIPDTPGALVSSDLLPRTGQGQAREAGVVGVMANCRAKSAGAVS